MKRSIERRRFLNGVAGTAVGLLAARTVVRKPIQARLSLSTMKTPGG
jgi:hypothetical protein